MKDILYGILFFLIFIVFGVMLWTNELTNKRLAETEKSIKELNVLVKNNTMTNILHSKILEEIAKKINKIESKNFVVAKK